MQDDGGYQGYGDGNDVDYHDDHVYAICVTY